MLYEIAHYVRDHFSFLWEAIDLGNENLFYLTHKKRLDQLDSLVGAVSTEYSLRTACEGDVADLVEFFCEQPEKSYEFFRPHGFDKESVRKVVRNKAFLTFVVLKDDLIIGYFFLRCFVNGKCYRGKIVHKDWQGRGIAKLMGVAMTTVAEYLGLRMFGSISPNNIASLMSAKSSNDIIIHKILENGYYYMEFLPKYADSQNIIGEVTVYSAFMPQFSFVA